MREGSCSSGTTHTPHTLRRSAHLPAAEGDDCLHTMEDHGTTDGRTRTLSVQWHWDSLDVVCNLSKSLLNKKPIKGSPGGQNRSKSIMTHRQVGFRTMNAYLTLVPSESSHHADSCSMSHSGLPPTDVAPAASTKSRSGA